MFSDDLFKPAASIGLGAATDMDRMYCERAALTGSIERDVKAVEVLYDRIPQAERDTGRRKGPGSADRDRHKRLESESLELRRASEILRKASAFFAQAELDRRPK